MDVWSVGVIYYQMLFGRRPFGEGKTQDVILKEGTITNINTVEFPSTTTGDSKAPKVSEEAKDFIRTCLTPDQQYRYAAPPLFPSRETRHRPDVLALCQHSYFKPKERSTAK